MGNTLAAADPPRLATDLWQDMAKLREGIGSVIRGKDDAIELALVTLIAEGHLLIEDIPGVGKSTLARALAATVGGEFRRIQFTSDLLPGDLIGVTVLGPGMDRGEFRPGPLFANFVLADEINRAPPRTQSALLEAMAEQTISVDGVSHDLPAPFMVIATQNPSEHHGTYPLPESQRDRFMVRMAMGYTPAAVEVAMLRGSSRERDVMPAPVTTLDTLAACQAAAAEVFVHPDIAEYAQRVVQATRQHDAIRLGVSTRGALAWVRAARARAWLERRPQIAIDDLQELAIPCLAHRILTGPDADGSAAIAAEAIRDVVATTAVPR